MANINVRKRLESIQSELEQVGKHIALYSGVDEKQADVVDRIATDIAQSAAAIAQVARERQGVTNAKSLVKRVRKALGFTYP